MNSDHEQTIKSRLDYCAHYQRQPGMPEKEKCKAGVVYDQLARVEQLGRTGSALRLPCMRRNHDTGHRRGQPLCECPKHQWKSLEQATAEAKEIHEAMDRVVTMEPIIQKIQSDHRGETWQGWVDCPFCGAQITVVHSGMNGHTSGKCATEGCVEWQE